MKTYCALLLTVIGSVILVGCASIKKDMQADESLFPPEFGVKNDTLLAIDQEIFGYRGKLNHSLAVSYHGPYKIVTRAQLDAEYRDTGTYRWVFDTDKVKDHEVVRYYAIMTDRVGNRVYQTKPNGTLTTNMNGYLEKLDELRISRGGGK